MGVLLRMENEIAHTAQQIRNDNPVMWTKLCQALDHRLPLNLHDCSVILARTNDSHFIKRIERMGAGRFKAAMAFARGKTEQRTPSYTLSGEPVLLDYPQATEIKTSDFLALQSIERFGSVVPVKIADHLINCVAIAQLLKVPWRPVFAHDLHELYVGEVPVGFKSMLGDFNKYETAWMNYVHSHYNVWADGTAQDVTVCDMLALGYEVVTERHPAWRDILDDIGISIAWGTEIDPLNPQPSFEYEGHRVSMKSVASFASGCKFSVMLRDFECGGVCKCTGSSS